MKLRLISTICLWALILLLPSTFGVPGACFLVILFGLGTSWEAYNLFARQVKGFRPIGPILHTCFLFVASTFGAELNLSLQQAIFLTLVSAALFEMPQGAHRRWLQSYGAHLAHIFAISLPFALLIQLLQAHGVWIMIWLIAVIKFTDAGALLTGTAIGKHKMAPNLSPKKTWEGFFGGLATGVAAGALAYYFLGNELPFTLVQGLLISLPLALGGVFSDLIESALKREAGVKDSGKTIPGIGGCFDLTDSIILTVPLLSFFLQYLH